MILEVGLSTFRQVHLILQTLLHSLPPLLRHRLQCPCLTIALEKLRCFSCFTVASAVTTAFAVAELLAVFKLSVAQKLGVLPD